MAQFSEVYSVKTTVTKEQFLRQVLIELAKDGNAPLDVCTVKFGEVKERKRKILVYDAHIETEGTASVGYDREEIYYEEEKQYDVETKSYRYATVKKTRTVTDWQPFSARHTSDEACAIYNDETAKTASEADVFRIGDVLDALEDDAVEIQAESNMKVVSEALKKATEFCEAWAENGITYPGDHVKDKKFNTVSTVKQLVGYELPFYEVTYTYMEKTYKADGFACGALQVWAEVPQGGETLDVTGRAKEKAKPMKNISIYSWIGTGVLAILGGVVPSIQFVFILAAMAALVVGCVFYVKSKKIYNKEIEAATEELKTMKLDGLKKRLEECKYLPLTSEELSEINKAYFTFSALKHK